MSKPLDSRKNENADFYKQQIVLVKLLQKAKMTIEQAVEEFLEKSVSGLSQEKAIARYLRVDMLPFLSTTDPKAVRRPEIIACVEAKAQKTPIAAKQLLTYVKQLFQFLLE